MLTKKKLLATILSLMVGNTFMVTISNDSVEETMLSSQITEDHTTKYISQDLKYIKEEPITIKNTPKINKEYKQTLYKTVKLATDRTITIQKKEEWIDVEVSHYSDLQYTDYGQPSVDCMGEPLYNGCYAFNGLPINTKFEIVFEDGTIEYGIIRDRTAKYVHSKYPNRIDKFVKGATEKELYDMGIKKAKIRIIEEQ